MAKLNYKYVLTWMSIVLKNRIGIVSGRLTVIKFYKIVGKRSFWICKCKCGKEKSIRGDQITAKKVRSCGCLRIDQPSFFKHKMAKTKVYAVWCQMKARCLRKTHKSYRLYGARGITVEKSWTNKDNGFLNFLKDMGEPPFKKATLDRIDNNKGYYKENCRWTDYKTQSRNKRDNVLLTYKGMTKCITEWAEILGLKRNTIQYRLKRGWSHENALSIPVIKK